MPKIKDQQSTTQTAADAGAGCAVRDRLLIHCWREVSTTTVEIAVNFEVPQKGETRATTRSSSTTLGYIPEGLYYICTRMTVNLK